MDPGSGKDKHTNCRTCSKRVDPHSRQPVHRIGAQPPPRIPPLYTSCCYTSGNAQIAGAPNHTGMRYIVTGGAGFIGSNLAERLARNHEVVIIDDLSTGRRENLGHLIDHPGVTFVEGSVTDIDLLTDAFAGADGIFHQAAIASVPRSVEMPRETNVVNVGGTLNVLWAAKECGVPAVVAASTSAIYGDDPTFPKCETMAPTPLSPYAVSKLAGEYYGKVFADLYGIRTVLSTATFAE